jgi:hypothetical protein
MSSRILRLGSALALRNVYDCLAYRQCCHPNPSFRFCICLYVLASSRKICSFKLDAVPKPGLPAMHSKRSSRSLSRKPKNA